MKKSKNKQNSKVEVPKVTTFTPLNEKYGSNPLPNKVAVEKAPEGDLEEPLRGGWTPPKPPAIDPCAIQAVAVSPKKYSFWTVWGGVLIVVAIAVAIYFIVR